MCGDLLFKLNEKNNNNKNEKLTMIMRSIILCDSVIRFKWGGGELKG